jgi:hypothetical protein
VTYGSEIPSDDSGQRDLRVPADAGMLCGSGMAVRADPRVPPTAVLVRARLRATSAQLTLRPASTADGQTGACRDAGTTPGKNDQRGVIIDHDFNGPLARTPP